MQFKAFKSAREEAMLRSALTIHIDQSENAKLRQSQEEKSAYYNETQVSIHCRYVWYVLYAVIYKEKWDTKDDRSTTGKMH